MPHEDQFTAVGPPLAGSGVPRSGFSTKATGMHYGASVRGDRAGIVGACGGEAGSDSDVEGVGVFGSGQNIGVFGKTVNGGIARVAGVYGQDNDGQIGVLGAVMRGGTAVAGVNVSSLGNPLATFDNLPNPGSGKGTGVFGTSGSGTGVHGTSAEGFGVHGVSGSNTAVVGAGDRGFGVHGISASNTAVVGSSDRGFGVHGISNGANIGVCGTSVDGLGGFFESKNAAQIRLLPNSVPSPEGRVRGDGGELIATTGQGTAGEAVFALWFCVRAGSAESAAWDLVAGPRPYPGTAFTEGTSGVGVKHIQMRLNLLGGAGIVADGEFGPVTRQAVVDFQANAQITADGIVGPITWGSLFG